MRQFINKDILRKIEQKNFSLAENPIFGYNPLPLAEEELTRCLDLFEKTLPADFTDFRSSEVRKNMERMLYSVIEDISHIECYNQQYLTDLAEKTLREIYNVPDHIQIKSEIKPVDQIDVDFDFEEIEFINPAKKFELDEAIQKRIVLNGISHGSSIHVWKSVHHMVKDEIDQVNPRLMQLYSSYVALVSFLMWTFPIHRVSRNLKYGKNSGILVQGKCWLNNHEINAEAITFPVLLHEINKGIIDYLNLRSIPQDFTESQLKYLYSQTDLYEYEIWFGYLAPSLWNKMLHKEGASNIPKTIQNLCEMDLTKFNQYFINLQK